MINSTMTRTEQIRTPVRGAWIVPSRIKEALCRACVTVGDQDDTRRYDYTGILWGAGPDGEHWIISTDSYRVHMENYQPGEDEMPEYAPHPGEYYLLDGGAINHVLGTQTLRKSIVDLTIGTDDDGKTQITARNLHKKTPTPRTHPLPPSEHDYPDVFDKLPETDYVACPQVLLEDMIIALDGTKTAARADGNRIEVTAYPNLLTICAGNDRPGEHYVEADVMTLSGSHDNPATIRIDHRLLRPYLKRVQDTLLGDPIFRFHVPKLRERGNPFMLAVQTNRPTHRMAYYQFCIFNPEREKRRKEEAEQTTETEPVHA